MKNMSYEEFCGLLAVNSVTTANGGKRIGIAEGWIKRIGSAPTKDGKRSVANRLIKRYKPDAQTITALSDYVETL